MKNFDKPIVVIDGGQNHNGDIELAKQIIDICVRSGVDVIKWQKRTPELCVPEEIWDKPKETPWGTVEPYIEYRKKLEFGKEEYDEINKYCKKNNIEWTASVWDAKSLYFLMQYEVPYIKIPSALLTSYSLIEESISTGAPIVLSTGMSTIGEIENAVDLFPKDYPLTIMACTSTYPTPDSEVALNRIDNLYHLFVAPGHGSPVNPYRSVGYSSHHVSPLILCYAMVLGSKMVEAHGTVARELPGSDHSASLEEPGISLLCREAERIPDLLGKYDLNYFESELEKRKSLRGI